LSGADDWRTFKAFKKYAYDDVPSATLFATLPNSS
jgi:hypothetical protein